MTRLTDISRKILAPDTDGPEEMLSEKEVERITDEYSEKIQKEKARKKREREKGNY